MGQVSKKRLICVLAGLLFVAFVILFIGTAFFLTQPAQKGGQEQVLVVQEGWNLREVAEELQKRNIITNKALFMFWARVKGYGRRLRAGEYRLGPGMSPIRILEKLARGEILTHVVTIPEGFTKDQIGELLEKKGILEKQKFLALADNRNLVQAYGFSGPSFEGYLYPDTYHFARGSPARLVISTMVHRFQTVFEPLKARMEAVGMSQEEVVILASIVEKETGLEKERPLIASVFLNRLKRRMRLASDPTVIYGIADFDGNLTRKDLEEKTPYNTYMNYGLPPGPIANPGVAAIRAVLYPAETDYLYFVSKNDGSHRFSRTLAEHNRAVQIFQKRRHARP